MQDGSFFYPAASSRGIHLSKGSFNQSLASKAEGDYWNAEANGRACQ